MEFHNVKLLPKGLPEIIAQLVPYDIYPNTKVIAYARKGMGPKWLGSVLGYAGYDHVVSSFQIGLYPTMCCSNGGHGNAYRGTHSFHLWMGLLSTALHEIGHLAINALYDGLPHDMEHHFPGYLYVEKMADEWRDNALARILRVDSRLGQPSGMLTGYPGALAFKFLNGGGPWSKEGVNVHRIAEWRALKSGGQITPGDLVSAIIGHLRHSGYLKGEDDWRSIRKGLVAKSYRAINKAAGELGINRFFVNRRGWHYRMFNAAEAEAIFQHLIKTPISLVGVKGLGHKEWEWRGNNWEQVEVEGLRRTRRQQLRLPLGKQQSGAKCLGEGV